MPNYGHSLSLLCHQSREKSTFGWQKENGRKRIITIKSHSTSDDIHVKRNFRVVWYLKEALDVPSTGNGQ